MGRSVRRLVIAASMAALIVGASAQFVAAGEITGNGTLKEMHGRSECSFSGQEDLQWYLDDANTMPRTTVVRGEPARAQAWGQIPKADRDVIAGFGFHPGTACNPTKAGH
jgi:hypothetical protein